MRNILKVLMVMSVLATGCESAPATAVPSAPPTGIAAGLPTKRIPTSTAAPVRAVRTQTPGVPPTATLDMAAYPIRHTPPTLMLHRSNVKFDALQFLKDLIPILKEHQMHLVTYRDISAHPEMTASEQGRLFILTIDDIYLRYPIDASVLAMIAVLRQAGYPAVLAVITEGDYAYPDTVRTLKELSDSGWEIATHTDRHSNLGEMEKTAPRYVYTEVETSVEKIEKAIGWRPRTLVLPEGQMVNDPRFIKRAGILWIVGITGGSTFKASADMVYVGREGPDGDAAETFRVMMRRFNP